LGTNSQKHSRLLPNKNLRRARNEAPAPAPRAAPRSRKTRLLHKQRVHVHYLFTLDIYLYLSEILTKKSLCLRAEKASYDRRIDQIVFVFVQQSVEMNSRWKRDEIDADPAATISHEA
jgi:hypothetical protein